MAIDLEPVHVHGRETLAGEIARKLSVFLLSGKVRPGERIPSERKLAEQLGVGRSVVREALKSLTLLGLIEVRQGDGTYLKRADSAMLPQALEWGLLLGSKRINDLIEARHHIEVVIAGLAAERRDDVALGDLRRFLSLMRKTKDPDKFVAADVDFHFRLAEAAGNQTLAQILANVRSLLQVWISRVMHAADDFGPTLAEHVAIFDAVEAQDARTARAAMERHMGAATARLRATLLEHDEGHAAAIDAGLS